MKYAAAAATGAAFTAMIFYFVITSRDISEDIIMFLANGRSVVVNTGIDYENDRALLCLSDGALLSSNTMGAVIMKGKGFCHVDFVDTDKNL